MPARRTPLPESVLRRRAALGQRLRELRTEAGLSQDQLADRIGMERRSIQRYESGERDPRYTELLLIADALGVPVAALVG
ncbi:helix-turn-helix domain-containing protein [Streptomyces sp. MBT42]|uniref:helix-turn-helix domain-containing protein n=1 Tax=Streptomyces sp. MBT42 TaxID=1488373 RepID=UPI001E642840|nr:helix-turn-helix transcriptional regulator [Streptomyces sp. MBT42]MCD2461996.1 helix-turn-helix domain-containing protein [Streptomyces sp. MBT42]MCD2465559.1 helix-turn-helix domain-containing protein [Streptomyces sp. MBT42]